MLRLPARSAGGFGVVYEEYGADADRVRIQLGFREVSCDMFFTLRARPRLALVRAGHNFAFPPVRRPEQWPLVGFLPCSHGAIGCASGSAASRAQLDPPWCGEQREGLRQAVRRGTATPAMTTCPRSGSRCRVPRGSGRGALRPTFGGSMLALHGGICGVHGARRDRRHTSRRGQQVGARPTRLPGATGRQGS